MNPYREITDEEWQRVAPLLPELRPRIEMRGRPLADTRSVLNGVLWVMYSGATWSAIPRRYPSYQTCHRRFKSWYESGALKPVTEQLLGAASEDLCRLMEARMRTHISAPKKRAAARRRARAAFRVPPAVYNPAPATPVPAPPSACAASFKQAA
ncbi:transposase [Paraburkholderia sp. WC7.3g]|uniref:Transposase n=1 Tax=Paraburkholderia podalyriae TaxID=1938811 RepID=A0ABR7PH21_9BURK|nr:transposase [Paraburkholderia podalyriae]MBC8745662.1 transposase [Paraburkholderia podalyriae]